MLQNLYVIPDSIVSLSVFSYLYVRSYVLQNSYGMYELLNLCVKKKKINKRGYYTTLSYTTDTILPDLGTAE